MTDTPKTCLIIGAAGGIGTELTELLASDGWDLVLAGRQAERLAPLAAHTGAAAVALDATDFAAVDAVFKEHSGINAAVNLAGSILLKPAHSTSVEDFDNTMNQNLRTAFALTRAAGKAMRKTGGSVVLMTTTAAGAGLANHEAISAAKAGVEGLARSAAATYAAQNIRFNTVGPGLTDTPLAERITSNEASLKASQEMHPLGRIGTPREIARVIAFLLDPLNSWITGQTWYADGGLSRVRGR
ncbi:MAG: SDR family oxidoreductase [Planctomycetota bacterium]